MEYLRLRTHRGLFVRIITVGALLPMVLGATQFRTLQHQAWVDELDRSGCDPTEPHTVNLSPSAPIPDHIPRRHMHLIGP